MNSENLTFVEQSVREGGFSCAFCKTKCPPDFSQISCAYVIIEISYISWAYISHFKSRGHKILDLLIFKFIWHSDSRSFDIQLVWHSLKVAFYLSYINIYPNLIL